ncbi:hypothetical protein HGO21_03405 [Acinetobacter sp. CUI P1]|nr:hypothetical protein [Acinetobacter sp. CUI P1]
MEINITKSFRLSKDSFDRYIEVYKHENSNSKRLHKDVFTKLLEYYPFDTAYSEDIECRCSKKFHPQFKTNTPLEADINSNINEILNNEIKSFYEKNKEKYKGIKDTCNHIASIILKCPTNSKDANKLGENIYRATLNKTNLSLSNLIELEMKTDINLSDALRLSEFPAVSSLSEVFELLRDLEIPTHKLSRFINNLSRILILLASRSEKEFQDVIDDLKKQLPSE